MTHEDHIVLEEMQIGAAETSVDHFDDDSVIWYVDCLSLRLDDFARGRAFEDLADLNLFRHVA